MDILSSEQGLSEKSVKIFGDLMYQYISYIYISSLQSDMAMENPPIKN